MGSGAMGKRRSVTAPCGEETGARMSRLCSGHRSAMVEIGATFNLTILRGRLMAEMAHESVLRRAVLGVLVPGVLAGRTGSVVARTDNGLGVAWLIRLVDAQRDETVTRRAWEGETRMAHLA
jgi:hypothetical protein